MPSTVIMEGPATKERKRYIGFRVSVAEGPPPERRAMVEAMDEACHLRYD
jgi:hypothetical protein